MLGIDGDMVYRAYSYEAFEAHTKYTVIAERRV
jgi:hypothetical protein